MDRVLGSFRRGSTGLLDVLGGIEEFVIDECAFG